MLPRACLAPGGGSFFDLPAGGGSPEFRRVTDNGLALDELLVARFADLALPGRRGLGIWVEMQMVPVAPRLIRGGAGEGTLAVGPFRWAVGDEFEPVTAVVPPACRAGDVFEGKRPVVANRLARRDVGKRRLQDAVGVGQQVEAVEDARSFLEGDESLGRRLQLVVEDRRGVQHRDAGME